MIYGEQPTPTLADLRPGDVGFTSIAGAAGLTVALGQFVLGATPAEWNVRHVLMVVESASSTYEDRSVAGQASVAGIGPRIVQAMPSGAEEIEVGAEHWTKDYIYVRPAYPEKVIGLRTPQTMAQFVADFARQYVGTPYSFLDYVALAGLHLGIKNGPIRRYVTTSKHMICSQLADQSMSDAGWHVFNDGRLPQDVTPFALYRKMLTMRGQHLVPGGDWQPNGVAHFH